MCPERIVDKSAVVRIRAIMRSRTPCFPEGLRASRTNDVGENGVAIMRTKITVIDILETCRIIK